MVSNAIASFYEGLAVLIAAMMLFFAVAGFMTPMGIGGIVSAFILIFVEVITLLLMRSLYATRYVLTDKEIIIKTTMLIGGTKRIQLQNVDSVEKTLIPFGVRLFGASFHGGYYEIPNLGRVFLAITNFHDGLLLKTKSGNFIITPRNPDEFKETVRRLL